ncbi:MAG TPA: hypothetical protein VHY91_10380 [Pirellulales bacterium]|jgi:hypothetical protein|nr:hypothetical protein [Pirellulales bacterium]
MCDIALGLQEAALKEFAESVGGSYMSQWRELGLYDEDVEGWGQAFEQAMERTLGAGGRVHFNLTGIDIADALGGDPSYWVDRHAAWELQQIVAKRSWFDSTIFYLDGRQLTPDELARVGVVPR